MESEIDLILVSNSEAPSMTRRYLRELEEDLCEEQLENAALLVTELVTNSVLHASTEHPEEGIRLRVTTPTGMVRVEVTDTGSWSPDSRDYSLQPEGVSGWGFYLVDKLSDRWGVSTDGPTCVWFEISRRV